MKDRINLGIQHPDGSMTEIGATDAALVRRLLDTEKFPTIVERVSDDQNRALIGVAGYIHTEDSIDGDQQEWAAAFLRGFGMGHDYALIHGAIEGSAPSHTDDGTTRITLRNEEVRDLHCQFRRAELKGEHSEENRIQRQLGSYIALCLRPQPELPSNSGDTACPICGADHEPDWVLLREAWRHLMDAWERVQLEKAQGANSGSIAASAEFGSN